MAALGGDSPDFRRTKVGTVPRLPPFRPPPPSMATIRFPSPSCRASSTASASRGRIFGPATSRSTTTSMLCRICRSSRRSSVRRTTRPSTRARTKPCFSRSSNRSRYSPFWPRIRGASTRKPRARRAATAIRSRICSRRLGGDRPAALRAMPLAHPGIEHPQVVVDLGDRADGGARVRAGRLLRDGDRGAQAGDQVHVGLGHLARGTGGRSWTGSPRSAAGPRHRACRRPASSCPTR